MQLEITTKHNVVFTVEYFEGQEGGMDTEQYGDEVNSIEAAIGLLKLAQVNDKKQDWVIVGRVETLISKAP